MKLLWRISLIWLLIFVRSYAADMIELVNGDRITGEIIKEEGGTVFFRSDLLGDLTFPRASIRTVPAAGTATAPPVAPPAAVVPPVASAPKKSRPAGGTPSVPVEKLEKKKPAHSFRETLHIPDALTGKIRLNAYHRNDDYLQEYLDISPSLSLVKGKHSFNWAFNYRYKRDDNTRDGSWDKDDDRLTAEQKYRYKLNKRFFSQSRTYWERDLVDEIDPRIIQSFGLGVYVLNNDAFKLDVSVGAGYEYLDISDEVTQEITPAFEQSFRWVINSRFSFKETFSFDGDDTEFQYDFINELEAKLNGSLSIVLKHSVEYDKELTDGVVDESKDVRTAAQVQLKF